MRRSRQVWKKRWLEMAGASAVVGVDLQRISAWTCQCTGTRKSEAPRRCSLLPVDLEFINSIYIRI